MTLYLDPTVAQFRPEPLYEDALRDRLRDLDVPTFDLRSHEPPRNSGEGTAVNGPMPLGEKPDALTTG